MAIVDHIQYAWKKIFVKIELGSTTVGVAYFVRVTYFLKDFRFLRVQNKPTPTVVKFSELSRLIFYLFYESHKSKPAPTALFFFKFFSHLI